MCGELTAKVKIKKSRRVIWKAWGLTTQLNLEENVSKFTCCEATGVADSDLGGGGVAGLPPLDLSKLLDEPLVAAINVLVSGAWEFFNLLASFKFW